MKSVCIIGAGPAGLSACNELMRRDFKVTLLDEQPSPGGQIYRNITRATANTKALLGEDYATGFGLTENITQAIDTEQLEYITGAVVWSLNDNKHVSWKVNGDSFCASFDYILIATGAIERPVPIPGWTLPGVLTAGAAQILMKNSGRGLADTVLVGAGPLLLLVANQLVRAGTPPKAILETSSTFDEVKAAKYLRPDKVSLKYLNKGLGLISELKKAGIPRLRGVKELSISEQNDDLTISFNHKGSKRNMTSKYALLHFGVIPNLQITRALRAQHHWHKDNACFVPNVTELGALKSHDGYYLAGDGAGIAGADAAKISGQISALAIQSREGNLSKQDNLRLKTLIRQRDSYHSIRRFLDIAYQPAPSLFNPPDKTLVCRCEEVSAGEIKTAIANGAQGPNQAKAFTRCGMGLCQGRYCGPTVNQMFAHALNVSHEEAGYYQIRTPIKPITIGELSTHVNRDTEH